jgi:hypothetical protein
MKAAAMNNVITFDELKKTVEKLKSRPPRLLTSAELARIAKSREEMRSKIAAGAYIAIDERKGRT